MLVFMNRPGVDYLNVPQPVGVGNCRRVLRMR